MINIVVGTGYAGRRALAGLPIAGSIGINRSLHDAAYTVKAYDLDAGGRLPVDLSANYRLLYTVPPADSAANDVRLTRLLAELDPPPIALVYLSTTGVYGNCEGAMVDESYLTDPQTARARRRVAAEAMLQTWSAANEIRLCILRVPGIYGPHRLGTAGIRAAIPLIAEADANPGNRIHVHDLATCCITALLDDSVDGIFNVGDGDFRTSTWFAQEVARQAGLETPPVVSRKQAENEFSAQRLSYLAQSRRIDTTRMRDVLGVAPLYADAADGIRESLAAESA